MPLRWVLSPVVSIPQFNADDGTTRFYRGPKVSTYTEPGRGKPYQLTSIIDAPNWCVSLVKATDFTPLDGDNQIANLFDIDFEDGTDILAQTPRQLGWNAARVNKLATVLTNKGVDTTGLTIDTPLGTWLDRLCAAIATWAKPGKLRI